MAELHNSPARTLCFGTFADSVGLCRNVESPVSRQAQGCAGDPKELHSSASSASSKRRPVVWATSTVAESAGYWTAALR